MTHAPAQPSTATPAPDRLLRLILVGAGGRGTTYAGYATDTGRAEIIAVAEPDPERAAATLARHPGATHHPTWQALAEHPPEADAVLITTQDADHVEPTLRFAELGYHILLEKPMATSEDDVRRIVDAVQKAGVMLAVCHVLRYTPYTQGVKEIVDSGRLGDIVSVEHLEPVGWWHQAHSYVRGNWRREDQATPMLLAKSSHDLDWLSYIVGSPVTKVSSFGALTHFRPENRPAAAADNCLDCPVEPTCPYSAPRLYLGCLGHPDRERWPLGAVTDSRTPEGITQALREGPYGRCVYACDNDVVDHQVVNLEYATGATASFTMTAFTPFTHRKTRIFGTRGSLDGDGVNATVTDFVTGHEETLVLGVDGPDAGSGHGGGDERLVDAFLDALTTGDETLILSAPATSLESHLVAWAAERARHQGSVEALTP
ncbi:Gfo/Idh/MocA family protein [Kitasatospora sp. NPDC059327]|uniref:Gfo/Idh/MocA family protein n=1 Tax=Kitasatospora sp. NPDC059327 TaxID=3346803 RepID=UPI00369A3427